MVVSFPKVKQKFIKYNLIMLTKKVNTLTSPFVLLKHYDSKTNPDPLYEQIHQKLSTHLCSIVNKKFAKTLHSV